MTPSPETAREARERIARENDSAVRKAIASGVAVDRILAKLERDLERMRARGWVK